jgi:hypothetical protein
VQSFPIFRKRVAPHFPGFNTWTIFVGPFMTCMSSNGPLATLSLVASLLVPGCTTSLSFKGLPRSIDRMSQEIVLTWDKPTNARFSAIHLISVGLDGQTRLATVSGRTLEAMPGQMFHPEGETLLPGRGAYFLVSADHEKGEARIQVYYCVYH